MNDPVDQQAPTQGFKITPGDDLLFTIRILIDGDPVALDDYDFNAEIRDKKTKSLIGTIAKGDGIDPVVSPIGDATVRIPGSITESLRTFACLITDIQVTNPDGIKRTYVYIPITTDRPDVTQI